MHIGSRLILASSVFLAAGFAFVIVESSRHRSMPPSRSSNPEWVASGALEAPHLDITSVVQHGDIYEIVGTAEPGSSVMINGKYAPIVFENSMFKYFIGPLPNGVTVLTITVQNEYGGVYTKQVPLTLP